MFSKNRKSQSGFSLVELMVVVAIIGVLASIAVPQVNKYIAKARQSEAKTILSSIYTSEKAFFAEYSAYHGMFGAIGYSPEGKLRYNAGFSATTNAGTAQGFNNPPTALPGTAVTTGTYCGANGNMAFGCTVLNGLTGNPPPAPTNAVLALNSFTVAAHALIYGATTDEWTIDNNKDLRNRVPGIN
ncbi:pilus assembly protein PilA [Bdellovibrio bacteriovorus]|uniref:Pilus assembly protein PilA n=1 Tax=Bdellovibrio bacteriovorus TaxID=959 RepID=A0A150WFI2_BDEBC|nr:prepilin-type N-terminal cleavage/methylation domain-containing protein [Bdellovibrio bacteriovorus]KYG61703.1 pilus assembly protein PilA [Bdellovibrio bacteriovorus]